MSNRYYNDLEPHDRSVAHDRLEYAAWEASQDVEDEYYEEDDELYEAEDGECPLCGRSTCMGYCQV